MQIISIYMYILTDHVLEMIILYPSKMYYSISIYHNSPIQDIFLNIEDILYLQGYLFIFQMDQTLFFSSFLQRVMRDLIKRYIMQKQRGPLRGEGVTEDDVQEIKQDISSFRYELLEILRNNGMKTPNPNQPKPTSKKMRYWKQLCGGLSESFDSTQSQNGFPMEQSTFPFFTVYQSNPMLCLFVPLQPFGATIWMQQKNQIVTCQREKMSSSTVVFFVKQHCLF